MFLKYFLDDDGTLRQRSACLFTYTPSPSPLTLLILYIIKKFETSSILHTSHTPDTKGKNYRGIKGVRRHCLWVVPGRGSIVGIVIVSARSDLILYDRHTYHSSSVIAERISKSRYLRTHTI
jgi:hypothetical protein